MPIKKIKKAKIIYDRLYKEYDKWENQEVFAKEMFGVTRQQIYTRKNQGKWDEQKLKEIFPEINTKWLHAETYEELLELPVKAPKTQEKYPLNSRKEEIEDIKRRILGLEQGEDGVDNNHKELDNLLESLQDHLTSATKVVERIVEIRQ